MCVGVMCVQAALTRMGSQGSQLGSIQAASTTLSRAGSTARVAALGTHSASGAASQPPAAAPLPDFPPAPQSTAGNMSFTPRSLDEVTLAGTVGGRGGAAGGGGDAGPWSARAVMMSGDGRGGGVGGGAPMAGWVSGPDLYCDALLQVRRVSSGTYSPCTAT